MIKIEKLILALFFGMPFSLASGQVEYHRLSKVGIGCGGDRSSPCYSEVLHSGIPFAFVIDDYKDPGIGILDMAEDTFVIWAFVANSLFYAIVFYVFLNYMMSKMKWPRVRNRVS